MKIILASKSGVRKKILDKYKINNEVMVSNIDEDEVKTSLLAEGADPLAVSKNLAEIKSLKVSNKNPDRIVLGADSVVSFNNELINKYSKYKFFISSSSFEGNPKTVLEAMSSGCIVLLSDIENHKELVNDNENGYIVKFNESYKQKIEEISKDFDTLKKVSEKAVVKVNKNNHIDKLVNDLYKDYEFLSSK